MRVRLQYKSKPNNYTESCMVNVADGHICLGSSEVMGENEITPERTHFPEVCKDHTPFS